MAPKKLFFSKQEEQQQKQANEETQSKSSSESDSSDSESQGNQAIQLVAAIKPMFYLPRQEEASAPEPAPEPKPETESESESESGDGSDCSSPSASGFIIVPSVKPAEKKKTPVSKIFSDEDEVALLQGLASFWANGKNNKWTEFHQFIKNDLRHEFTKIQISEKIRSLKRKFESNLKKYMGKGGKLDLSDPHESVIFNLSKQLWDDDDNLMVGSNDDAEEKKKAPHHNPRKSAAAEHEEGKRKKKRVVEGTGYEQEKWKKKRVVNETEHGEEKTNEKRVAEGIEKKDFGSKYPFLWASLQGFPSMARENIHLIGREKAEELEEKWRKLTADDLGLKLKRMELMRRELKCQLMNS